jgi:UDP-N-acetyl-D-mannosaminuronic acid transferase (WecB/TagA/CpsF family)
MTDNGLEWVYLSLRRPRRFFDRYLVGNPRFVLRVLLQRIGQAFRSPPYDPPAHGSRG